jgi:RNA recognition motif-containing protein
MQQQVGVYFENLPPLYTREDVRQLFQAFGNLQNVFLATRLSGKSLGFGYVLYGARAEADAAVKALNGLTMMHGGTLRVWLQDFVSVQSF